MVIFVFTLLSGAFISSDIAAGRQSIGFGNWSGGSHYSSSTNEFTHCAIEASYVSGDHLLFVYDREGAFSVGVANESWNLPTDARYRIALAIDNRRPFYGDAGTLNPKLAVARFSDAVDLFRALQKGRILRIRTESSELTYDLTGTSRALRQLAECTIAELELESGRHAAAGRNPFAADTPEIGSAGVAGAQGTAELDRAELSIFASNLLSGAGVTGHRLLSAAERPKAFEGWPIVWAGPGKVLGAVQGYQVGSFEAAHGMVDAAARLIGQSDAGGCDGKFASDAEEARWSDDIYVRNISTACMAKEQSWRVDYGLYATRDGRLLKVAVISDMAADEPPADPPASFRTLDIKAVDVLAGN